MRCFVPTRLRGGRALAGLALLLLTVHACCGQGITVFRTHFDTSAGNPNTLFAKYGWTPSAATGSGWRIVEYAAVSNNPGPVVEFMAGYTNETLAKTVPTITDPVRLTFTFDAGRVWGASNNSPGSVLQVRLLDDTGSGYQFMFHRVLATWAFQRSFVSNYVPGTSTWAPAAVDGTQVAIKSGGGLANFSIVRTNSGRWSVYSSLWGNASPVRFTGTNVQSFSQIQLVGLANSYNVPAYNNLTLEILPAAPTSGLMFAVR